MHVKHEFLMGHPGALVHKVKWSIFGFTHEEWTVFWDGRIQGVSHESEEEAWRQAYQRALAR